MLTYKAAQITMETSTSYMEALSLPFYLFDNLYDDLVEISEKRQKEMDKIGKGN